MFQSCFPSFAPKENIKKEIRQETVLLKWIDIIGTLDQDYPDYITIQIGKQKDTICQSHNIANLRVVQGNTIIIEFYGPPQKYNELITIPEEMLGYKIEIDTTSKKKEIK